MTNGITVTRSKIGQTAALANLAMFDKEGTAKYRTGFSSPQVCLRAGLYASLVVRLFNTAKQHAGIPRVLDLEQEKARPHFLFSNSGLM